MINAQNIIFLILIIIIVVGNPGDYLLELKIVSFGIYKKWHNSTNII